MKKIEREILESIRQKMVVHEVSNPADLKNILKHYYEAIKTAKILRGYLDELSCFDIPDERLKDIKNELSCL